MGMYGGIAEGIKYNDRRKAEGIKYNDRRKDVEYEKQLQSERHNQNMAIGNARLNKYNYEESQRPIEEQRKQSKYDLDMGIGKNQLKQQELTADAFAKEHGWKEEDYNRKKAEYNAANWAKVQGEGGLDLIHNAINGADKRATIEAFNKQGTPIIDYRVNPDGSITTVLADGIGKEDIINPHQVGAALDYRMGRKSTERKEARLDKALDNKIELGNKKIEQGDARLGQGNRRLTLAELKNSLKTETDARKEIAAMDKDIDRLVISGVKAINPMTGLPYDTTQLNARIQEHNDRKGDILKLYPNLDKKTTTPPPAVGGKPEPVYGAPSGAENPEPVSQDIKDGIEWINKNPNDPRTEAIRKKFRELGVIGI